ncbi:site-2 protease family protein [candidate division WWE3 bacterium]|nr:site-2 protease family protein [candidate division WWE3 bacterium]
MFVFILLALTMAISVHECAHAYAAYKLGDASAKYLGRITLNPKAHIDTTGLLFLLITGFGWGKPVPFNPMFLKNPRRDSALIALAGPVSNFILAIILAIIYKFLPSGEVLLFSLIKTLVFIVIQYNLVLGIFNLIPVEPLDGFKIVAGVLPHDLAIQWMQIRPYGLWILLILVFTGTTEKIMTPIFAVVSGLLGI